VNTKNFSFLENVVVITGASTGIGRELALQLADQGAWLALAARNTEKLEDVAAECRRRSGKALAIPTDVTERRQCAKLIKQTVVAYGRIDTLINNAGITLQGRFDEIPDVDWMEQIMRVNYLGSAYCTHYALPRLKRAHGRIVGISSTSGKWGLPKVSSYAASKHAMAGFFDSLRIELSDCNVSVTMVYPSFVATHGRSTSHTVMSVEACAHAIVKAVAQRKREIILPSLGRAGLWLRLIAPGAFDRYLRNVMERQDIGRSSLAQQSA
jgi:short-subunit dehydrogenase